MALRTGERVGVYEITGPLGKGGMGEVYRGRDTKLDREVAVKVLPEALARDQERLIRFEREAKALAALNHPSIAQIYAVEGTALIMELVPGETLAERMRRGAIPLEESLRLAEQMAAALDAAHEKGIVHRDFKPGNVMVTPDGVVKVLDFGLVGRAPSQNGSDTGQSPEDSPTLTLAATQAGFIMGTAAYMAPEQASGRPVDKRADIWAFGVVLWEMLSGKRLFEGETISHVLAAVLTKEPDLTVVPERTRALIARCLEKDPRKRLRDIGDAMGLVTGERAVAVDQGGIAPWRSRLGWMAAGISVVALAGLAFVHFREAPSAPTAPLVASINPPEGITFGAAEISPDGTRLAIIGNTADGKSQIWLRPMDSTVSIALAGTEGARAPIWSPDSRFIGFVADNKLKKIDSTGGPALTLTEVGSRYGGGAWSKTGVILFTAKDVTMVVPAAGGTPRKIREGAHTQPWFLPDGRHYLYLDPVKLEIRVASLDSGNETTVASGLNPTGPAYSQGHVFFRKQGVLMAQPFDADHLVTQGEAFPVSEEVGGLSVSSTGVLVYRPRNRTFKEQLTWVDRTGKVLSTVGEPETMAQIQLSPDNRSLMTAIHPGGQLGDFWLWDLGRGLKTRFTFDPTGTMDGTWTPDGSAFVYRKERKGIYRKSVNGGAEELLQTESDITRPTGITPDGKLLLYQRVGSASTGFDIYALPLTAAKPQAYPLLATPFSDQTPIISPDGRWVAYVSNESGRQEVYITPFTARGMNASVKWQVSTGGTAFHVRWRRDGRELYYLSRAGDLMAAEITASKDTIQVGKITTLFGGVPTIVAETYDVSADGQRFIVAKIVDQRQGAEPLTVVSNWLAAVKK